MYSGHTFLQYITETRVLARRSYVFKRHRLQCSCRRKQSFALWVLVMFLDKLCHHVSKCGGELWARTIARCVLLCFAPCLYRVLCAMFICSFFYFFVCECVCVRACVRTCVRACVWVCVCFVCCFFGQVYIVGFVSSLCHGFCVKFISWVLCHVYFVGFVPC